MNNDNSDKNNRRNIVLLGSTGSIGLNALSVIDALPDNYSLIAASAHSSWQQLANQARKYHLKTVVITDTACTDCVDKLRNALKDTDTRVLCGSEHLEALSSSPDCDIVIVAVVGVSALPAVLAACRAGKRVAIANKESLVVAGPLVMEAARKYNAQILPVDSEHSAIMQAMQSGSSREVERLIITCSGGAFRGVSLEKLAYVTVSDALAHPTWQMGPKITIDSATLMNKALEIIEARWLFDIEADKIEVVIHPESIIHSMVEFCDGSVIAQMSLPDMKIPIQYALTWPDRVSCPVNRLRLYELGQLTFFPPDRERFGALELGFEVARAGGSAGVVFNAANEAAVDAFRAGEIGFMQITELVKHCLNKHDFIKEPVLEELMELDTWARRCVKANL